MEFRSYPLTGAKQNFPIHYLPDRRMPNIDSCHIYNINPGNFQTMDKSPIPKPSGFLHTIASLGQRPAMPFSFGCSVPYDSKKKFVNHKRSFSTLRENNFIKDPMESKVVPPEEGYYYSSKGTGGVCSTISSHIIGGFVGSKSQVNNKGKTKACDLGSFIFDVLNNMKWGRSEDRPAKSKNMECNQQQQAAPQQLRHIIQGSSHKTDEKLDTKLNFGNVISISDSRDIEEKKLSCDSKKINGLNGTCIQFNISSEPRIINSCSKTSDKPVSETMEKKPEKCETKIINSICSKLNNENSSKTVPLVASSDIKSSKVADSPTNSKCLDNNRKDKPNEPQTSGFLGSCLKNKICSAIESRLRLLSECSVDSTDSESFIVFDDRSCELLDDEDDDDLEEMDEDEDNNADDDYGCYSIAEANAKWKAWYSDEDAALCSDSENKKVKFNDRINVHLMVAWDFAYRAARLGPWEQMARDRCRFRDRILRLEMTLSPVLREDHREKIYKSLYS